MPPASYEITEYVVGDRLDIKRTVKNIPPGRRVAKSQCNVKADIDDPDPGLVQKIITTAEQGLVGQILDDGWNGGQGGSAILLFQFTANDTMAIGYDMERVMGIKVFLDNGDPVTVERETKITLKEGVVKATS